MRRVRWAVLFLIAFPAARTHAEEPAPAPVAAAPGAFWTTDELRRIDLALEVANCDRKDLGFFKRPIDDPFRLPVVDQVLDDALVHQRPPLPSGSCCSSMKRALSSSRTTASP